MEPVVWNVMNILKAIVDSMKTEKGLSKSEIFGSFGFIYLFKLYKRERENL